MAEEKILIIQGEEDTTLFAANLLREQGYRTSVARDGLTGLNLALQEQPDLILLDLQLPRMSGVALLSELQKYHFTAPVVVTTPARSRDLDIRGIGMLVKEYVSKPFDASELLQAIECALQENRLRRERDSLATQLNAADQQLDLQARWLTSLYEAGHALAYITDLDELLHRLLQEACRALEIDLASVFLLDEQNGHLIFRLGTGGGAEHLVGRRLAPLQGIAGWVAERGEPLLVPDARRDPRFSPAFDQITGLVTESLLCVPMATQGRVVGVIQALNKPEPGFSEDDLAVLHALAASAAVAIENADLYQQLSQSDNTTSRSSTDLKTVLRKLVRLQRVALALGAQTIGADLTEVYRRLTDYAATLLGVKRSAVFLYDSHVQELICQEPAYGLTAEIVHDYRIPLRPGSPIWDAWQNGQSLTVNEPVTSPLAEALGMRGHVKLGDERSTMFATLRLSGRSAGLFLVSDKLDGSDFTVEDQRLLEIFASQAATSIENAHLLASEKRRASEMETLVEMAQAVTEAVTERPQALLERIVTGACKLMRADSAAIFPFVNGETDAYDVPNVAAYGTRHPVEASRLAALDDPVHLVRRRNVLVCRDISQEHPALLKSPFFAGESTRAFFAVLLKIQGEELGVLYVNYRTSHHFEERELTMARLIAHQAALAIAKSQLFDTLKRDLLHTNQDLLRKLRETDELLKINTMISTRAETTKVFDRILQGAMSFTGAPNASILMIDRESGAVVTQMRRKDRSISGTIDLSEMMATPSSVDAKGSFIVEDIAQSTAIDSPWLTVFRQLIPDARSFVFVPILGGRERKQIGLLGVGSPQRQKFSADDVWLMEALANQAAITVQSTHF